jgi:hypothetical protein
VPYAVRFFQRLNSESLRDRALISMGNESISCASFIFPTLLETKYIGSYVVLYRKEELATIIQL